MCRPFTVVCNAGEAVRVRERRDGGEHRRDRQTRATDETQRVETAPKSGCSAAGHVMPGRLSGGDTTVELFRSELNVVTALEILLGSTQFLF